MISLTCTRAAETFEKQSRHGAGRQDRSREHDFYTGKTSSTLSLQTPLLMEGAIVSFDESSSFDSTSISMSPDGESFAQILSNIVAVPE